MHFVREQHGGSRAAAPSEPWLERYLSQLPDSQKPVARAVWERRQGKTVSETLDTMILPYLKDLGEVLNEKEWAAAGTTWFSFLPTFEFNAHSSRTPRGDRVVLLHQTLALTLSLWSRWYLRVVSEGHDPLRSDAGQLRAVLQFFAEVWSGHPPADVPEGVFPSTQDAWELDDALTTAAMVFVLGHELGHVMLGHRGYGDSIAVNHAMEFAADSVGLAIVARHALSKSAADGDTYFTKFRLFAPLFATAVMSFHNDRDSRTHPSPARRRKRLLKDLPDVLRDLLGDEYRERIDELDGKQLYKRFDRNSQGIFDTFAKYRSLMPDVSVAYNTSSPAWLDEQFPHRWQ